MDHVSHIRELDASAPLVLNIEDVASVTRLIEVSLGGKDLALETVTDGRAGLAAAIALRPSLILLDLALPSMHGFDVLRELKSHEATASIPVIVVTAQADSETAHKARELGADRFIAKPFVPNELRRAVDALLERPSAPSR